MTSVEQLIGDLLLRHNCVIVPSFGGFVAKKTSAKVDFNNGLMHPPTKSLLFNKQLTNNDGLLINELAQGNGISFNEAAAQVTSLAEDWNRTLLSGGRINLDKVGYLYADSEKNICFEQDRFFNLLLESFGMGQVRFVADEAVQKISIPEPIIEKIEKSIIVEKNGEEEKNLPKVTKVRELKPNIVTQEKIVEKNPPSLTPRIKTKPWKYIAAACILPFAFYSFWIPMKTDVLESGVLSINDFNPFHKTVQSKYQKEELSSDLLIDKNEASALENNIAELPEDVNVYTYKYDDDLFLQINVKTSDEQGGYQYEDLSTSKEDFSSDAMNFIVGCFGEESNAINLVAKLKSQGLDARIFDVKNGLHRVSAGSAISMESYNKIKSTATSLGYKGWTLK